jgi:hypothetical protein
MQMYNFIKKISCSNEYLLPFFYIKNKVYSEYRFDILVNEMMLLTELNVSFGPQELIGIAECIRFKDYNLRALNLLHGFCTYNEFSRQEYRLEIIKLLFQKYEVRV